MFFSKFPKDFREDTFMSICKIIEKKESLQLVGAPGSGNTIIVKALTQIPKIREKYLKGKKDYNFVMLDGNLLLEKDSLTLLRLFLNLFDVDVEISSDSIFVQKQITKKVDSICSSGNLVIIIDHLQELDHPELKSFFIFLSDLYRNYESQISFIFCSTKAFTHSSQLGNFANLKRLMMENVIYSTVFDSRDTEWFIKESEKSLDVRLKESQRKNIFRLSGGFPRTMKRLVDSVGKGFSLDEIATNPGVEASLSLHLDELSGYEHMAERVPLLQTYLESKVSIGSKERVGKVIFQKRLTKIEEKVFQFLLKRKGEIVKRNEVIEKVWGKKAVDISDHAYDQIIHRLRGKLIGSRPQLEIETVRGRGHCLRTKG